MDLLKTTGQTLLDLELDRLIGRVAALEAAVTVLKTGKSAPVAPAPAAIAVLNAVRSLTPGTGAAVSGDVTLIAAGALTIGSASQTVTLTVGLASTVQPVGSAGVVGVSTNAAREDHAHAGLHSLNNLLGDVTIVSGGGCTITVIGQQVQIKVP